MDLENINRIENEALADETENAPQAEAQPDGLPLVNQDTAAQFADFLDIAAKIASHGLNVPTIAQRFTHEANLGIATAAVKLCDKYGIDAKAILIGEDSTIGAWLGLVVAIGLPGYAVYQDIKFIKAKAAAEAANDDNIKQQQQG